MKSYFIPKRVMIASGFNTAFAAQKQAQTLDDEQKDLKANLKTKTASLDSTIDNLEKLLSEARKVVKLEMEKESWKSFGIADSR
jgi:hypothetical protein